MSEPRRIPARFEAVFALLFSVAILAAVASPAFRDPPFDSFPLSDYPMFSHGRPSPMFTLTHAVGIRDDGSATPLEPMVSTGNREVLQSMVTIVGGVRSNATRFCSEVAGRVALDDDLNGVREVALRTETWDTVAYFASDEGSEARRGQDVVEHARCPVSR